MKSAIRIKRTIFAFILSTILTSNLFAQINISDSTAQIIGYWSIGDMQSYQVSYEKYKVTEQDTSSRMSIKYEVDISIKDSTENSYLIEWFYKNYEIQSDNELINEISKAAQDISVIIKTDELGIVVEVVNWEEVRDYISEAMKPIKKKTKKLPNVKKILEQYTSIYSSKEAIETNAIKDIIQFYNFHGGKYTLNEEINSQMQFANNFGGEPFDVDVKLSLEELNYEDDNSVIRMYQSVNSAQLTKATYEYLISLGTFGNEKIDINELPSLTNETWTASRTHGNTGWTTYSIETKETKAEGTTNVEERIIEIQ